MAQQQPKKKKDPKPLGFAAFGEKPATGISGTDLQKATDASQIVKDFSKLKLSEVGGQLYVKPDELSKNIEVERFLKGNPEFKPLSQEQLDMFQKFKLFGDFVLPLEPPKFQQGGEVASLDNIKMLLDPVLKAVQSSMDQGAFGKASPFGIEGRGGPSVIVLEDGTVAVRDANDPNATYKRVESFTGGAEGGVRTGGNIQKFQQGGQVSNPFIRVPAAQLMQQGGQIDQQFTPAQQSRGFNLPQESQKAPGKTTDFTGNLINQLGNVKANTGQLDSAAGGLQSFNPFGGAVGQANQGALTGILNNGNPVDVSPITQAAQSQAGQGFQDFLGQSNEQFGALGLGSSSAKTAAQAKEANRLQTNVGNTGLIAGVGAQENAANRQLAGTGQALNASGQQLSGKQAAGGLFGQSAGLDLNAQLGPLGPSTSLGNNLINQTANQVSQPGTGGIGQQGFNVPGNSRNGFLTNRQYAKGGRVDFGDYLSNLTFGQQFNRPEAQSFRMPQFGSSGARTPQEFHPTRDPNNTEAPKMGFNQIMGLMEQLGANRQQQLGGPGVITGNSRQSALETGQGMVDQFNPGLLRALMGFQDGGVIEGPSVPPDQVPIMAQGGEGVIPVHLMAALRDAGDNPQALVKVAREIQRVMSQNGGEDEMQFGGQVGPDITMSGGLAGDPRGQTFNLPQDSSGVFQFPGSGPGAGIPTNPQSQQPALAGTGQSSQMQAAPQGTTSFGQAQVTQADPSARLAALGMQSGGRVGNIQGSSFTGAPNPFFVPPQHVGPREAIAAQSGPRADIAAQQGPSDLVGQPQNQANLNISNSQPKQPQAQLTPEMMQAFLQYFQSLQQQPQGMQQGGQIPTQFQGQPGTFGEVSAIDTPTLSALAQAFEQAQRRANAVSSGLATGTQGSNANFLASGIPGAAFSARDKATEALLGEQQQQAQLEAAQGNQAAQIEAARLGAEGQVNAARAYGGGRDEKELRNSISDLQRMFVAQGFVPTDPPVSMLIKAQLKQQGWSDQQIDQAMGVDAAPTPPGEPPPNTGVRSLANINPADQGGSSRSLGQAAVQGLPSLASEVGQRAFDFNNQVVNPVEHLKRIQRATTDVGNTIEQRMGFNPGDVPGNTPEEISFNAKRMQRLGGVMELVRELGIDRGAQATPGMAKAIERMGGIFQGAARAGTLTDEFFNTDQGRDVTMLFNLMAEFKKNRGQ